MAKCTGTTKAGEPCKSNGRPETNGLCFIHYKQSQGQDPYKIRIRAVAIYKNGTIGDPVRAGVGIGEVVEVTPVQWKQIQADDPDAFVQSA